MSVDSNKKGQPMYFCFKLDHCIMLIAILSTVFNKKQSTQVCKLNIIVLPRSLHFFSNGLFFILNAVIHNFKHFTVKPLRRSARRKWFAQSSPFRF